MPGHQWKNTVREATPGGPLRHYTQNMCVCRNVFFKTVLLLSGNHRIRQLKSRMGLSTVCCERRGDEERRTCRVGDCRPGGSKVGRGFRKDHKEVECDMKSNN